MTREERTKLIKHLKYNRSIGADYTITDNEADEIIKALEQTLWIPVNEQLPKRDGYYKVMEKSGRIGTYVFHKEGNSKEYWERCAVAWMPESYKAE